jgi:hypothetical protein
VNLHGIVAHTYECKEQGFSHIYNLLGRTLEEEVPYDLHAYQLVGEDCILVHIPIVLQELIRDVVM